MDRESQDDFVNQLAAKAMGSTQRAGIRAVRQSTGFSELSAAAGVSKLACWSVSLLC